jgi:cytochrome c oxidase assembly protein subunit 15
VTGGPNAFATVPGHRGRFGGAKWMPVERPSMTDGAASLPRRLAARISFPGLMAGTAVLLVATVLLGVATKATGAGLACQARWPVCDGGLLNLFPQSFPSFFEWIHRVVAGTAGLAVVASAVVAWRRGVDRTARLAVTGAAALVPLQVLLGRETVVTFTLPVLTAHFWTAVGIVTLSYAATAVAWRAALTPARLRYGAFVAAALVPVQVLLHPPVVTRFTPVLQTVQYAVVLAVFAVAVAVAVRARAVLGGRTATAALAVAAAQPLAVFFGRNLVDLGAGLFPLYAGAALALFVGLVALGRAFGGAEDAPTAGRGASPAD